MIVLALLLATQTVDPEIVAASGDTRKVVRVAPDTQLTQKVKRPSAALDKIMADIRAGR